MAENRGGRRVPDKPASYSGVGKNSKRTDGQPVRAPNVQDSTDLTQGDRATIEAGQSSRPLSKSGPRDVAQSGSFLGRIRGESDPSALGEHVFSLPTTRPTEPLTQGLPFGEGGGPEVLQSNQIPDDKQLLLDFLARGGNEDAIRIRSGIAEQQRPPEMPSALSIFGGEAGLESEGFGAEVGAEEEDDLIDDASEMFGRATEAAGEGLRATGEWLSEPVGPDNPTFGSQESNDGKVEVNKPQWVRDREAKARKKNERRKGRGQQR